MCIDIPAGGWKLFRAANNVKTKTTQRAAAQKFFERGVQRGKIFFKKFFPSGRGEAAKRRKPALKGLGKTRVFPNFPFQMLAFETENRWRGSGGTGRFPPRFGLSTVENERSSKWLCAFQSKQRNKKAHSFWKCAFCLKPLNNERISFPLKWENIIPAPR